MCACGYVVCISISVNVYIYVCMCIFEGIIYMFAYMWGRA